VGRFHLPAIGVLAATLTTLGAQPPQHPLTLQDCIRLAESVPSNLTLASGERSIAAQEVTQARAGLLPQSQIDNGIVYNSPSRTNRDTISYVALNGVREYVSTITVNQEFDTSGRLRAGLSRARIAREMATTSMALAQRDLRRAVTTAYYRALLTRRLERSTADALAEGRAFEIRVRKLAQGGEAAQADVVKAAAQTAFLEQASSNAELEAQLANQELAAFWTRDVSTPLVLADVLEETPKPPEPEPVPYMKRLEFNLLDAERRGYQADYRTARAALLPQLGVTFQYGLDANAVHISERGYAAFVNLTIPLFDWNRARGAMTQARLRAKQVETTRAISERTLSKEYQAALARAKRFFDQIAITSRQSALAADDLRLSRIRYEGGEGSALDVVTSQNQLAQARANYYTTLANYLNARADLEVAAGR
jgi:outer membrane protein TolC